PLSPSDEKKYLQLKENGDREARNKLIEHNLRLVAHIVKKFDNTGEQNEDLISIGTIGLIKGVESFKTGKGTKLVTYATRCIEKNKLIKHNLRLVTDIKKKVNNTGEQNEDLISIGTIGLIKGVESFKTGKGTKLVTYAARCIENEILMYLSTLKKTRKDVSLY